MVKKCTPRHAFLIPNGYPISVQVPRHRVNKDYPQIQEMFPQKLRAVRRACQGVSAPGKTSEGRVDVEGLIQTYGWTRFRAGSPDAITHLSSTGGHESRLRNTLNIESSRKKLDRGGFQLQHAVTEPVQRVSCHCGDWRQSHLGGHGLW
jgi:hypothetical protein